LHGAIYFQENKIYLLNYYKNLNILIHHHYWLEKIISGQYSAQLLDYLLMKYSDTRKKLPFDVWIHTDECKKYIGDFQKMIQTLPEYNKIESFQVKYLTQEERKKYVVSFKKTKIMLFL